MNEYEVFLTVVETYIVQANSKAEALGLAYSGQAGDAQERQDISSHVQES
jgi:hypothetical protein